MIDLILSNLEWLIGGVVAIFGALVLRQGGKHKANVDQLKDAQKREEAGRDAVKEHHTKDRDDSPDAIVDRMRRRDGDSRGL